MSGIGNGLVSSLIYAFVGSLTAVIVASSAAYSIAMLKVRFPFFWFLLIYSGTVFPFQMYLMPLFGMYQSVGLYDTRFGMLLFYSAIAVPFCIFVFRNYFIGMQGEVIEAASLDGASSFQTYLRIVLPMAKAPALFLFVTQFSWIWNDFLFGQVLAKSDDVRPVMTSLAMLSRHIRQRHSPPTDGRRADGIDSDAHPVLRASKAFYAGHYFEHRRRVKEPPFWQGSGAL